MKFLYEINSFGGLSANYIKNMLEIYLRETARIGRREGNRAITLRIKGPVKDVAEKRKELDKMFEDYGLEIKLNLYKVVA